MDSNYKAYAAGLFDGEGSIYMTGHNHNSTVTVKVTNTNLDLCRIYLKWGGTINNIKTYNNLQKHQLYRWCLYGRAALPFLEDLEGYLIAKARLAHEAIVYLKQKNYLLVGSIEATQRFRVAEEIYRLNSL